MEDLRAAVAMLPTDVGGSEPSTRAEEARSAVAGDALVTRLLPAIAALKIEGPAAPRFPGATGPYMEREKGFESGVTPGFSAPYATSEKAPQSSSQPPDASAHVPTEHVGGDTQRISTTLPPPTPEMFLQAGLVVADRAARALVGKTVLDEIVHRAVQHAVALRGGHA